MEYQTTGSTGGQNSQPQPGMHSVNAGAPDYRTIIRAQANDAKWGNPTRHENFPLTKFE
ncbi:MAG: hypothetical protein PHS97_03035 [Oscillospiraceae bacterium]|nr:hypothetical protein [Oscillospiraceae bacterium]